MAHKPLVLRSICLQCGFMVSARTFESVTRSMDEHVVYCQVAKPLLADTSAS